jgi:hypothetical protein
VYAPDKKLPPNNYDTRAFGAPPDMKRCLDFLAIQNFAARMGISERKMIAEAKRINTYAAKAYKAGYDTADALKYIQESISGEYGNFLESTAKKILSDLLKKDPKNPKYRLLKLDLNSFSATGSLSKVKKELNSILKEAEKRSDREALGEAQSKINKLDEISFAEHLPEQLPPEVRAILEEMKEAAQMEEYSDPFPPRPRRKNRKKNPSSRKTSKKSSKAGKQVSETPAETPRDDGSTQLDIFDL